MPKHGRKAEKINAYFKLRHGESKENKKPTKISKAKQGYKKRK